MFKPFDKKVLRFAPSENYLDGFVPAKKHIPEWYKSAKGYNKNNIEFYENNEAKTNFKSCIPFLDTLTSGYIVELFCDLHFEIVDNDGSHFVRWGELDFEPIKIRNSEANKEVPVPVGCEPTQYLWSFPYHIEAPEGYSIMVTHPLNRFDLPFISLTGIIDADSCVSSGFLPFFVKKDFSGVIEKGTPIAQVIPFKRENWVSEQDDLLKEKGENNRKKTRSVFFGSYKHDRWHKKTYE